MNRVLPVLTAVCIAWLGAGCSYPAEGTNDADRRNTRGDQIGSSTSAISGASRSFALASTGMRFFPRDNVRTQLADFIATTDVNLATDVDIVAVHQDFYGLPWKAFEQGTPPPAEWLARVDEHAAQAKALNKPVFLTVSIVQGADRQFLADDVTISDGKLTVVQQTAPRCYDFATAGDAESKKAAYLRYVEFMIGKFDPVYVNIAPEINFFQVCGDAWDALVEVERAAYDAAKAAKPGVVVFPSFLVELLYGLNSDFCKRLCGSCNQQECYDVGYKKLANLARDRFAMSIYPWSVGLRGKDVTPEYITRGAVRGGERPVVAETGWSTSPLLALRGPEGTPCYKMPFPYSDQDAAAYLDVLLDTAQASNMDLVTYWSNRDLIPSELMSSCPCTFDDAWCGLVEQLTKGFADDPAASFGIEMGIKGSGTMGLRNYDGSTKPALEERWRQAKQLPIQGSSQDR